MIGSDYANIQNSGAIPVVLGYNSYLCKLFSPIYCDMRKYFLPLLILLVQTVALTACSESEEPKATPDDNLPQEPCVRTLLVYMAADNNLGGWFDQSDLTEMETGFSNAPAGSRLVVYHDSRTNAPVLKELTAKGWKQLKEYPDNDSGICATDPERMEEVIADTKLFAPAARYGLVLWSHGNGWITSASSRSPMRAFGDDRGRSMSIPTLARVLEGKEFDYIYFDCCSMAGVEVAYELRHVTGHVLGSASLLPPDGMPYDSNIPLLLAEDPDLRGVAENTFNFYDTKTGTDRWCTIALIDCSALDRLASATVAAMSTATRMAAKDEVQSISLYTGNNFLDFADYVEKCRPADEAALAVWRTALEDAVPYHACTPVIYENGRRDCAIPMETFCGISTAVLAGRAQSALQGYDTLCWWKDVASHYPFPD